MLDDHVLPLLKESKFYDALKEGVEQILKILEEYFMNPPKDESEKGDI